MDLFVRTLNPLLMIAMPLVLAAVLARRLDSPWRLFGVGMLTFVGAQLFHLPFNAWILNPLLDRMGASMAAASPAQLLLIVSLLGLSAGIFEEGARYLVYRRWLKAERTWRMAWMFAAGHGGIEAILLGGLTLYGVFQAAALRTADLSALVPAEQLQLVQAQLDVFWALPWYLVLLGAVERGAALCLHLGLTVLVLLAITRRRILWLWLAVFWHALANAVGLFALHSWGVYVAEGLIVLAGLASLGLVFALRTPDGETVPPPAHAPLQLELRPSDPTDEQLEASRYE